MNFWTIANQMLSLFFIMAAGYAAAKAGVIDEIATKRMTALVLNVALPPQVILAFLKGRGLVTSMELLQVAGLSLGTYFVFAAVAVVFLLLFRVKKSQHGLYIFMAMFSNVGFMGYPVIQAVLGQDAMIYAVIINSVFNIIVYSVGIVLVSGGSGSFDPRVLLNVPMFSSALALALFFTKIQLPYFMENAFGYMANLVTPMAMLILGSSMARIPVRELFDDWRIYVFTAVRLGVIPIIVLGIMRSLHIQNPLMSGTLVILAAMPVATNTTMLAIQYDGDIHLASKGVFFTTLVSVISIPLIAMLL